MTDSNPKSFKILEDVIFLKKSSLFSTMRTAELRAVAGIAEEMTFKTGEEIVREGELGDSMFMIRSGSVSIVKNANGGQKLVLATLHKGDCFGDMAIFDAEVRSASAIAAESCVLLRIDSDSLIDVLGEYPTIAIGLLKIFVQRLREANTKIQVLSATENKGDPN